MKADLVIRHGTLVTGQGQLRAGLAVVEGKIAAVANDEVLPEARENIDATRRKR